MQATAGATGSVRTHLTRIRSYESSQILDLEFIESVDDPVSPDQGLTFMRSGHADDAEPTGKARFYADMGILENNAFGRPPVNSCRRGQENLGIGLSMGNVLGRDQVAEKRPQPHHGEGGLDIQAVG